MGLGSEQYGTLSMNAMTMGGPMHFSESKLGSNHWSRRELLRRWGGGRQRTKSSGKGIERTGTLLISTEICLPGTEDRNLQTLNLQGAL